MLVKHRHRHRLLMASPYIEIDRCKLIPLSLPSLCACQSRRPSSFSPQTLILSRPIPSNSRLRLCFDGSRGILRVPRGISVNQHRAEPDRIDEGESKEEVDMGYNLLMKEDSASERQEKAEKLKKRIIFGLSIGISSGVVVLAGGWVFTVVVASAVFVGAREYFELVRSRGITAGMTPPPRYVSRVCSIICAFMPMLTLYFGQIDVSVTSAAFVVAMALLLQRGNPRFSQLSSTMFGLFYCGYLPCFWVKLRCGLAVPALNTRGGTAWPLVLGGQNQWTVGLVATLISISSIIAADTFAFVGGKAFGRTPLTNISPKKTWEGAVAGLGGCVAISVLLSRILSWPPSFRRMVVVWDIISSA